MGLSLIKYSSNPSGKSVSLVLNRQVSISLGKQLSSLGKCMSLFYYFH